MGNGGEAAACSGALPHLPFRAPQPRLGMGWVKLVLGVGVAAYSYRSVTHVNSLVRQIAVPKYSLLAKHTQNKKKTKEYKDAFKISLPPHYRVLKGTGSEHEVFSRLEGPLIKVFLYGTDAISGFNPATRPGKDKSIEDRMLEMKAFRFKQGDSYLLWKVVARESDEILMRWDVGGFQGTTWFHIPSHENCIVFGSSFPVPSLEEKEHRSLPMKLYVDSARNLPSDAPVGLRIRAAIVKGLVNGLTGVHVIYSKYLLLSAYNKIVEEEETKRDR